MLLPLYGRRQALRNQNVEASMNQTDQLAVTLSIIGTVVVVACVTASALGLVLPAVWVLAPLGITLIFAAVFVYCARSDE